LKPKVLVIAGPTASGKKKLAFAAAETFNGEIVSADSRKVYRLLDIGTAKPDIKTREKIPHHLIDILDPDEAFSAGDWVEKASIAVENILSRGKLPIISGGTGFYIRAFMQGLSEGITSDPLIRAELKTELEEKGAAGLHAKLALIDPERAAAVHVNDTFRILRALEIYYSTGKTHSELKSLEKLSGGDYDFLYIGVSSERETLYSVINRRVDEMIREGLENEIRGVLARDYPLAIPAFDTVGYREWFPYIDGEISFNECVDNIKKNTRHYAKRQMTWFRAEKDIEWFDISTDMDTVFERISSWLG
jgi:tRNA dimethylallyltransferase